MKRLAVLAGAIALTLCLAACQQPAENDSHQAVDTAIHEIEHVITEFYQLGPSAPPEELAAVIEELQAPWSELAAAAQADEDLDVSNATAAYEELSAAGETLSSGENANTSEVVARMAAFRAAIEELHAGGDFH